MESRVLKSIELHKHGYNCAQAVLCNYADLLHLDEKTAFKISEGFGLGIAGTKQTCGAVSAMIMVLGLVNSTGNLNQPNSKVKTYKDGAFLIQEFEKKNTSSKCYDLKGFQTGKPLRSCDGCIMDCCNIIEKTIFKDKF